MIDDFSICTILIFYKHFFGACCSSSEVWILMKNLGLMSNWISQLWPFWTLQIFDISRNFLEFFFWNSLDSNLANGMETRWFFVDFLLIFVFSQFSSIFLINQRASIPCQMLTENQKSMKHENFQQLLYLYQEFLLARTTWKPNVSERATFTRSATENLYKVSINI